MVRAFLQRPAWRGIWLGLLCAVAAWVITRSPLLRGMEDWLLDGCFFYRGSRATQCRVVLIALDDASLAEMRKPLMYLSPELAEVVSHARQQNAAAIGIDFIVPEGLSDLPEIQNPGGQGDATKLGQAVLDAGNVVLAQWRLGGGWQRPLLQWQAKSLNNPDPGDLAFVNLTEDDDQFVRRQQLIIRDGDEKIPHFALALFARARGAGIVWDDDRGELRVGSNRIPLDAEQRLRINFTGPPGAFQTLAFRDVLAAARDNRPLPELAGAIVLVGVTAHSQQDYHNTPYANHYARYLSTQAAGVMAGTEIHAHILATLSDGAYITTPPWLAPLPLLLLFGALLGRAFARLNLEWGLALALAHHFAWKGVVLTAFKYASWRVEISSMLLLGFLAYTATFALRWRTLRRMMGVVKSEAIALALETDPRRLDPGGEERELTILFGDIRSFTDFSEKHSPHEVVALLNAYFTAVVPLIETEGGTINTYMGDGIMVLFGAPASCSDHALRATRAGVAMVQKVHELSATWAKLGNPSMRIGVGIHTGKVVVGAIGSPRRLDYTAIGDAVNTAARIEAENKPLKTEVLLSKATYDALDPVDRRSLRCGSEPHEVTVKGKSERLLLYPIEVS